MAACLYDPVCRIGGMNHILLPGYTELSVMDGSARYGVNAMELLINRIMSLGGIRRNLVAKIFGGANVIDTLSADHPIGMQNTAFVLEFLHKDGIKVVSHDTGGTETRIIRFHTDTGEVFLKRLCAVKIPSLVVREKKVVKLIEEEIEKSGEIDLFSID